MCHEHHQVLSQQQSCFFVASCIWNYHLGFTGVLAEGCIMQAKELRILKPNLQKEQEASTLLKEANVGICNELAETQSQLAQKALLFSDLKEVNLQFFSC